jgi:hypothetical protein
VYLEGRFRVSDAGVRVRFSYQSLEDPLDLNSRGRSEAVAGD